MCLSVPAKILALTQAKAKVEVYGLQKEVFLACEGARVGDWVLVHGTIALHVLEPEAAGETIKLLEALRDK